MRIEMKIKELRNEKNISTTVLSNRSGVSATAISDIEKNYKSPKLITVVKLAKALNKDIKELYKVYW